MTAQASLQVKARNFCSIKYFIFYKNHLTQSQGLLSSGEDNSCGRAETCCYSQNCIYQQPVMKPSPRLFLWETETWVGTAHNLCCNSCLSSVQRHQGIQQLSHRGYTQLNQVACARAYVLKDTQTVSVCPRAS